MVCLVIMDLGFPYVFGTFHLFFTSEHPASAGVMPVVGVAKALVYSTFHPPWYFQKLWTSGIHTIHIRRESLVPSPHVSHR